MGRKKAFINKKDSSTYSLTYRSVEDEAAAPDGPDSPTNDAAAAAAAGFKAGDSGRISRSATHPLELLKLVDEPGLINAKRRSEIVEAGFPDDGYDYLQHLRVLGRGQAAIEGLATSLQNTVESATGPSVFVAANKFSAPEEDVKMVDARSVEVQGTVTDDRQATEAGISRGASSKPQGVIRGEAVAEVEDVTRDMDALEAKDLIGDESDAELGDWLDDFVVSASKGGSAEANGNRPQRGLCQPNDSGVLHSRAAGCDDSNEDEDEDEDETGPSMFSSGTEEEGGVGHDSPGISGQGAGVAAAGSSGRCLVGQPASHLGGLDAQFDHMLDEYSDGELGELGDGESAHGDHEVSRYSHMFGGRGGAGGGGVGGAGPVLQPPEGCSLLPIGQPKVESFELVDKEVIAATKARIQRLQVVEEEGGAEGGLGDRAGGDYSTVMVETERWDCESILSLKSNVSYQPGRISEGPGRRRGPGSIASTAGGNVQPGCIKLSTKTGLPVVKGEGRVGLFPEGYVEAPSAPGGVDGGVGSIASFATSMSMARKKDESGEEKKERKGMVREHRRMARAQKKELRGIYKEEEVRQQKVAAGMRGGATTLVLP